MTQSSTSRENNSEWRKLYVAAILETDNAQLKARLERAEDAINSRLQELDGDGANEEKAELADACHGINVLRKERQLSEQQRSA